MSGIIYLFTIFWLFNLLVVPDDTLREIFKNYSWLLELLVHILTLGLFLISRISLCISSEHLFRVSDVSCLETGGFLQLVGSKCISAIKVSMGPLVSLESGQGYLIFTLIMLILPQVCPWVSSDHMDHCNHCREYAGLTIEENPLSFCLWERSFRSKQTLYIFVVSWFPFIEWWNVLLFWPRGHCCS